MENNVATLETVYETRKPRGFGWAFKPIDQLAFDMFEKRDHEEHRRLF